MWVCMFVCMYVCLYVCQYHGQKRPRMYVCMSLCMSISWTDASTYIYIYIYMYVCMSTCAHVHSSSRCPPTSLESLQSKSSGLGPSLGGLHQKRLQKSACCRWSLPSPPPYLYRMVCGLVRGHLLWLWGRVGRPGRRLQPSCPYKRRSLGRTVSAVFPLALWGLASLEPAPPAEGRRSLYIKIRGGGRFIVGGGRFT